MCDPIATRCHAIIKRSSVKRDSTVFTFITARVIPVSIWLIFFSLRQINLVPSSFLFIMTVTCQSYSTYQINQHCYSFGYFFIFEQQIGISYFVENTVPLAEKFDRFQILRFNTQQHPTTCNRVCKRTQHVTSKAPCKRTQHCCPIIPTDSNEAHLPTPRYGQYLTHAHNHITRAVAAMDSCFALVAAHQHGIAVGSMSRVMELALKGVLALASAVKGL